MGPSPWGLNSESTALGRGSLNYLCLVRCLPLVCFSEGGVVDAQDYVSQAFHPPVFSFLKVVALCIWGWVVLGEYRADRIRKTDSSKLVTP